MLSGTAFGVDKVLGLEGLEFQVGPWKHAVLSCGHKVLNSHQSGIHCRQPIAMMRTIKRMVMLLIMTGATPHPGFSQSNPHLQTFFQQIIGLNQDQIAAIRNGQAVAKAMPCRTPAEIFLFGAVYIHAVPEAFVLFAHDFDRLRKLPSYLGLGVFSSPPQLSELTGFSFDNDDVQALERCKPGNYLIQGPASSMEEFHRSIDWSASNVNVQVNELLQAKRCSFCLPTSATAIRSSDVYNDKHKPVEVAQQFAYMVSYYKALPEHLPEFYQYLLSYPNARPANVEDTFYWARVKFGLKPTLRIVHVVTMRGNLPMK